MPIDSPGAVLLELVPPNTRRKLRRYQRDSRRPVYGAATVLGFALLYEIAVRAAAAAPGQGVLAHGFIRNVLAWVGLPQPWVVPSATAAVLTYWLWSSRERRALLRVPVIGGVLLEGLVLALPLLVAGALFSDPSPGHWLAALGAATYEEFLFRLVGLVLTRATLAEVFRVGRTAALWLAILVSAAAFAIGHFAPFGGGAFVTRVFWFKFAAGVYLGMLFDQRGLAVTTACHVAYNLMTLLLRGGG